MGRINAALTADAGGAAAAAKIYILDIFGFEIFEHNSFEQLLINFANEKLQQHFNLHVFKMEEELYEGAGIDYGKVGFVDNSPVLSLLERKAAGLLPILDEAVVMPGGSDATFYRKLAAAHGTSPLLTMLSRATTASASRSRCRTTPASSCTTPEASATRMATRCWRISATPC